MPSQGNWEIWRKLRRYTGIMMFPYVVILTQLDMSKNKNPVGYPEKTGLLKLVTSPNRYGEEATSTIKGLHNIIC